MIKYTLTCSNAHQFDSWFGSSDAYEKLAVAKLIECVQCGDTDVKKALMAPHVQFDRRAAPDLTEPPPGATPEAAPGQPAGPATHHAQRAPTPEPPAVAPAEQPPLSAEALRAMRRQIEATSDYVGGGFAKEARRIHDGEAPERSIYGEANEAEVRSLLDAGVSISPLPFIPTRKTN